MLTNNTRCFKSEREKYSCEVQEYLKKNAFILVQKLYFGILGKGKLRKSKLKELLGKNYPVAPDTYKEDITTQFISIFQEIGYFFYYMQKGKLKIDPAKLRNLIIKNHLKFNGSEIIKRLAANCEKTNGRITYSSMCEIFGFSYPNENDSSTNENSVVIILFLKETGIPFLCDETHIYLP